MPAVPANWTMRTPINWFAPWPLSLGVMNKYPFKITHCSSRAYLLRKQEFEILKRIVLNFKACDGRVTLNLISPVEFVRIYAALPNSRVLRARSRSYINIISHKMIGIFDNCARRFGSAFNFTVPAKATLWLLRPANNGSAAQVILN